MIEATTTGSAPPHDAHTPAWLIVAAGLASCVVPGTGQLIRRLYLRGAAFLVLWILTVFASAGLRLWANPAIFGLIAIAFVGLGLWAGLDAAFHATDARQHRARCLVAVLFITVAGFALNVPKQAWIVSGFHLYRFASSSMEPTVMKGEVFVGDSRYYSRHAIQRGDVVSLLTKDGFITLKRVIAVPGDTIEAKDRVVNLNGKIIEESYVQHTLGDFSAAEFQNTFGPVKLRDAEYFVMGDNRDISLDSRSPDVGTIPQSRIKGKALYLISYQTSDRNGRAIR